MKPSLTSIMQILNRRSLVFRSRLFSPDLSSRSVLRKPSPGLTIETLEPRELLAGDTLVISELLAVNDGSLADEDGEFRDWLELHNPTDSAVALEGWSITDDENDLAKWQFPDVTLDPGGYLVIFASGKDRADAASELHASFKLSGSGEFLALVDPEETIVYQYSPEFPIQQADISYGVVFDKGLVTDELAFFALPTPGAVNSREQLQFVAAVEISVESGFYEETQQVEIATATDGATILYTVDGSEPTQENGSIYAGPVLVDTTTVLRAKAVKEGFEPSKTETRSYLYLEDVLQQDGAGFPENWGMWQDPDTGEQVPRPANYAMDPRVVNSPLYRDTIKNDLRAIPTLSLVLDNDDFFGPQGIYSNPGGRGVGNEKVVSAELIGLDGEVDFRVDAGIRMHGGHRRCKCVSKHQFRLLFKADYGPTKLKSSWFGPDSFDEFDTVVLRASTSFVEDRWAAMTQNEMGGSAPHGTFVHLYINGLYWGVYAPIERPDASFAANYLGGDKEDYDSLLVNVAKDGDTVAWNEFLNTVIDPVINPAEGEDPAVLDYEAVKQQLDVPAFIDYMLVNQTIGNNDWPTINWYVTRERSETGKWRFHSWDAENIWDQVDANLSSLGASKGPGGVYTALTTNAEFRLLFADRVQRHFFNGGALTPEASQERLDSILTFLGRSMVGESARWGDGTFDNWWLPKFEDMKNNYFPQRSDIVVQQFRNVGLFPSQNAPVFEVDGTPQHGGLIAENAELTAPAGRGIKIYFTTDGSDPRLPGGAISPSAEQWSGSLSISERTTIKARTKVGTGWSAVSEAIFSIHQDASAENFAITEINYNPTGPTPEEIAAGFTDGDQFEFIELQNTSDQTIDLSGVQFNNGIEFDFAGSPIMTLAPGEYVLVVQDAAAFAARYGDGLNIAGQYGGMPDDFKLNNDGERLRILGRTGETIANFRYNDSAAWPAKADGQGSTLVVADIAGDYNEASNWRSSSEDGGSPGFAGETSASVTNVLVSSSQWSSTVFDELGEQGVSLLSQDQPITLPWANLDQIKVTLSQDIALSAEDLSLNGVLGGDYLSEIGLAVDGFVYDPVSFTATWTLAGPLEADRLQLTLSNASVDQAIYEFSVLPGDINGDQRVDIRDLQILRPALLTDVGMPRYLLQGDLDGSGTIDQRDVSIMRQWMLRNRGISIS